MTPYTHLQSTLRNAPRTWLVTGVEGFIDTHTAFGLLAWGGEVDNGRVALGHRRKAIIGLPVRATFTLSHGPTQGLMEIVGDK